MKINNLILSLFGLLAYPALIGCQAATPRVGAPGSILLILGADVSPSVPFQEQFDTSLVRRACLRVAASGRGGAIAFETIGDPIARGFLRCEIQANPPTDRSLPPSRRRQAEKAWQEIHRQNLLRIQVFVDSCQRRLKITGQQHTDLNGFFQRAGRLSQEPQYAGYEKIVYVNSDGEHDVVRKQGGKAVRERQRNCQLPTGVALWVSGWKTPPTNQRFSFESPNGFSAYFDQHLQQKNVSGYGK